MGFALNRIHFIMLTLLLVVILSVTHVVQVCIECSVFSFHFIYKFISGALNCQIFVFLMRLLILVAYISTSINDSLDCLILKCPIPSFGVVVDVDMSTC